MARLTITLSDARHQALNEAAVRRGRTIGEPEPIANTKAHLEGRPGTSNVVAAFSLEKQVRHAA